MFVILTSKPGQFRTELVEGLEQIESYDYIFHGRCKAHFVIARLHQRVKIRIVDETPPEVVNMIPSKLLEKFDTIAQARKVLHDLARHSNTETSLVQRITAFSDKSGNLP